MNIEALKDEVVLLEIKNADTARLNYRLFSFQVFFNRFLDIKYKTDVIVTKRRILLPLASLNQSNEHALSIYFDKAELKVSRAMTFVISSYELNGDDLIIHAQGYIHKLRVVVFKEGKKIESTIRELVGK
ncbi:MAG: hypothetical protein JWO73_180 [Candidatus Taylorbacteria bacterium]|nr:hypothetical protein [Candidatus Taylorbacteria bacterium]